MIKFLQIGGGDFWKTCSLISMLLLACLPGNVQGATIYKRITTLEELGDGGRFLIVAYYETGSTYQAMTNSLKSTSSASYFDITTVSMDKDNNTITDIGKATVWTIAKDAKGTYSITDGKSYVGYMGSSTKATFNSTLTTSEQHTVACTDDGSFIFTSQQIEENKKDPNRYIGFNNTRFAYYTNPNTYKPICLYKETEEGLQEAGLTWGANKSFACTPSTIGTFTQPTLSNPNNLTVTYESDNTAVATVDGNGTITLTGTAGTVHITAKSEANETYDAGTAIYTITVSAVCTSISALKALITPDHNSASNAVSFEATLDNAIVTYQTTTAAYIQDATGGIYINTTHDLKEGTSISGLITGTAFVNNGLREINSIDVSKATTGKATITAEEVTIADLLANFEVYECKRIKIKDANLTDSPAKYTWTMEQNGSTLTLFRRGIASVNATVGSNINVTGYPYMDGDTPKFDIRRQTACELNITISDLGYATYYNDVIFKPAKGLEVGIVTATDDNKLVIDWNTCASSVPNGTGVLLRGAAGTYACETGLSATAPANNLLHGAVTATTPENTGCKYYKLANGEDGLGFYWGAENGAAFESGAFKAYLAIPTEANVNVRALLLDELEATGIAHVSADNDNTTVNVYSLDGRCVRMNAAQTTALDGLQKGLYIVNGKKYLVK